LSSAGRHLRRPVGHAGGGPDCRGSQDPVPVPVDPVRELRRGL